MSYIAVDESILTEAERRQLAELQRRQTELREAIGRRVETQIDSLEASKHRLRQAQREADDARGIYHEALLALAEDPDDDFDLAFEKRAKMESVEAEFLRTGLALQACVRKCTWEIEQAEKL